MHECSTHAAARLWLSVVTRGEGVDSQHLFETKLFIYTSGGGVMLGVVSWFLKDLVITVKEVSKSLITQNEQIIRILSRIERHDERIGSIERKIDR